MEKITLQELRLKAQFSKRKLAREAKVDFDTVHRAETGQRVQDTKAAAILDTLNQTLNTKYSISDIEGIVTL